MSSVHGLARILVGQVLLELGELMLSIDLCQQALQHQSDIMLLVVSMDDLDCVLEDGDSFLNIVLLVSIVAVDLAQLVQDQAQSPLAIGEFRRLGR